MVDEGQVQVPEKHPETCHKGQQNASLSFPPLKLFLPITWSNNSYPVGCIGLGFQSCKPVLSRNQFGVNCLRNRASRTMTQPSKLSLSCVHACKQRAVPESSKHNYESTQLIRGLYLRNQSMPSITSDVSYGSAQQGTPGIEYAVPAPTTAVKSK